MALVSSTNMLEHARKNNYGIGAFNIHSLDMLYAVAEAAAEKDSPVIIQTTTGTVKQLGAEVIAYNATKAADMHQIPIALHVDHCQDYDIILQCVRAGYTSVMIDASMHPFEENVKRTLEVVKVAKPLAINVEAELGKVGGVEDEIVVAEVDAEKAVPEECLEFVQRTGVQTLAPAIGTAHGIYSGATNIDFSRIEKIANLVEVPLVLHGGSAIPAAEVRKCVALGMAKMNVSTELKNAYSAALERHFSEDPGAFDPRSYFTKAKQQAQEVVKDKIDLLGSGGQKPFETEKNYLAVK